MNQTPNNKKHWLTIIGIGEEGETHLSETAKNQLQKASLILGSSRQLNLIPTERSPNATRETWPSPMMPRLDQLRNDRPENTVIIASGDPLCWGIAEHFITHLKQHELTIIPSVSILTRVAAEMQWPLNQIQSLSLCSQPLENLALYLQPQNKIVLLSATNTDPARVATFLIEKGFSNSEITVLENLGSETQSIYKSTANELAISQPAAKLNSLAITLIADATTRIISTHPGLPDQCFEHDGQMTKQNMRAITLAHLRPLPAQYLWDIGSGSGSIAIEWLRTGNATKATAIEQNQTRADRAKNNAANLGVPHLDLINGKAPDCLENLPAPDAIFIGGGITTNGLLEKALQSLKPGGRLVANTVTIEGEAKLIESYKSNGGNLTQIAMTNADPIGPSANAKFHGWRPQMPITQWVYIKPQ